ncbi:helix-turn-helix domain-containing protein [Mucilaginibacter sp. OK098]|uniref:helix-turn-helix domain-containing protein n=1 Tax=Mucilaginibacter sp. OK098 TaxID=1855297 RepID=UPI000921611E|nr:AraC family transcriptional regulator [Mucilaginibacter sp. OK098]SHN33631.1 AraC-type DNA-binding protein [Mucilaginibacter sp. OK098]
MINLYESVLQHPNYHRQFTCNESLITVFSCPAEARLMKNKFSTLWTQFNYLFYVVEGRKIWHTSEGSYDIGTGSCVFVRKGAFVLEQFSDVGFCLVLFFIPDDFICQTLGKKFSAPVKHAGNRQVITLNSSETLAGFFLSMASYFGEAKEPAQTLLELKFKELIFTIADNPGNAELLSYFCSLVNEPGTVALERIMADNYRYNLKLEQFAQLGNRSLSAFKRDFQTIFHTTAGKWLLEKRLLYAKSLLNIHSKKLISEVAFESGFESVAHFSRSFKQRFGVTPSSLSNQDTAV